MRDPKYKIGDQFKEGESLIVIIRIGNSKGVYYCRREPEGVYRPGRSLFEYRTEKELNELEEVIS